MQLNRDISLSAVAAFAASRGRPIDVADVLAGTGARSLRLAHELDAELTVHANDADPKAIRAIEGGIAANNIPEGRVEISHNEAFKFLASRRFDIVDIDPFGTPMPFLDAGIRATRHGGMICVTATDTAALAGTYPRVCRRRYGAEHHLHKAPWRQEIGLRILAGAVIRAAGRFDRKATPLLSVCKGHWMRVIARIEDGKQQTDETMRRLGYATLLPGHLGRIEASGETGPLWAGPLHDPEFAETLQPLEGGDPKLAPLLEIIREESNAAPFWADPGMLRREFDTDAPKRAVLAERLHEAGHGAARTHMDPQGIRTSATLQELRSLW